MGKKLIEVALPLDVINIASELDKRPEAGAYHPKGIHYYPARLPLPSARAILFSSLVDDPSAHPEKFPTEEAQEKERERLFSVIKDFCEPKIHTKPKAFEAAIKEIKKNCDNQLPTVHDPFSGGGAIPLEGMRLGMKSIAADLNPVSVFLNKATIELLPKFRKQVPVNPSLKNQTKGFDWDNAMGVAEDLKYYGGVIQQRAEVRLEKYFPKIDIKGSKQNTVLTYIWVRTVQCTNPICRCEMPLTKSFALRNKKGKKVFYKPIIETGTPNTLVGFEITNESPGQGTLKRNKAKCFACDEPVTLDYIKSEGKAGRMKSKLAAIVIDSGRGKNYISPNSEQELIALKAPKGWTPDFLMSDHPQYMAPPRFGLTHFKDLFTNRQLLSLNTFSDLIHEWHKENVNLIEKDYLNLLTMYLFFSLDRLADFNCNVSRWKPSGEEQMQLFSSNRMAMSIDYCETNPTAPKGICWTNAVNRTAESVQYTLNKFCEPGKAIQKNAEVTDPLLKNLLVSTDPPYYNNIPYADLMDFFYVWMKHNLEPYFPEITKTLLTPKSEELVANEFRFDGDKEKPRSILKVALSELLQFLKKQWTTAFLCPFTMHSNRKKPKTKVKTKTKQVTRLDLLQAGKLYWKL